MATITAEEIEQYLLKRQGLKVSVNQVRAEFGVERHTKSFDGVRNSMWELANRRDNPILVSIKGEDGWYKVITQVKPVRVFKPDRKEIPLFELIFPRDYTSTVEMDFGQEVVLREGDIILIAGMSNFGKTLLCLNFFGENIDKNPVLMGNEYTIQLSPEEAEKTGNKYDVSPRFYSRINAMSVTNVNTKGWVEWTDENGNDKFTLLPIWEDYAEHIVKDRINIIDWINLPGEYYMISPVMEKIKKALGRGIGILSIQKAENTDHGRGGAMTREFADLEILLDRLDDNQALLTIGKVKESKSPIVGKTYAFNSSGGVRIINFREVKKCTTCYGRGTVRDKTCDTCFGVKYVDK